MTAATIYGRILTPLTLAVCAVAFAQDAAEAQTTRPLAPLTGGTRYVVAFPDTTTNRRDSRFEPNFENVFMIYAYSAVKGNQVRIIPPGAAPVLETLAAGEFKAITIDPAWRPVVTEPNSVVKNGIMIEAKEPVILYCYMATKFGGEAWSPLPVEAWGRSYYAAALPGERVMDEIPAGEFNYWEKPKAAPAQILVTAAHDGTEVTIVPKGLPTSLPGTSADVKVTLNAGETYLIQSEVDTNELYRGPQQDLGGSRITASRPIGVITGNSRAMVLPADGLTGNSFKGMLVEALAPADQHGTEFVFLPSWAPQRITGHAGEKSAEKRPSEFVRIYGTSRGLTNGTCTESDGSGSAFEIVNGAFFSRRHDLPAARCFKTDQPAQGVMNSSATVKFNGTGPGIGEYIGSSFDAWAPYMVEMTPREQWGGFAPFFTPTTVTMEHYVNVVADTASAKKIVMSVGEGAEVPFEFNRGPIRGTDLVWGTISLPPGVTGHLAGEGDARFHAFVYGSSKGYEVFRPGIAKKPDGKGGAASQSDGKGGARPLHSSEYEEVVSVAYGYPLAPVRRALADPDLYTVDTRKDQEGFTVEIGTGKDEFAGIRSVELGEGSVNARLLFPGLEDGIHVAGEPSAVVKVVPVDPEAPMSAGLVVTDRTGAVTRVALGEQASGVEESERGETAFALTGNLPNPFSGRTDIRFSVGGSARTSLVVYNSLGEKVALLVDGVLPAGPHTVEWNAEGYPAGVYFCELNCGGRRAARMMIVR